METIELPRSEVLRFLRETAAPRLSGLKGGHRFLYALARTRDSFERVAKAVAEADKPPAPEFQEYLERRKDIVIQFADLDEAGQPRVENREYCIPADRRDECTEKLEELREECAKAVEAEDLRREQFQSFVEENEEVQVHKVDFCEVEKCEGIDGALMEVVLPIIREPAKEE